MILYFLHRLDRLFDLLSLENLADRLGLAHPLVQLKLYYI